MSILTSQMIKERLDLDDDSLDRKLIISPILENTQLNGASIDLRLGTEFKVSIPTRSPLIGIVDEPMEQFFQSTFRSFGENFILHPNQLVLVNTFEYIKIPNDLVGMISTRSSLNRLGLNVTSIIHPGYAGTLTLQLENNGVNAINLTCGMRLIQLVLFASEPVPQSYISNSVSKYISNTSPILSQINRDSDLKILKKFNQ
ncbi:dCTP deaminase [Caryophanon latum]|uniref:Deoxycytidine triphosphate deaminase n=1 Tax=Caryophanon latum TaxID=33977 RepID=A0A1C0YBA7_9BACL|nr:dCTP deaminase [Caryophanon latum]OCS84409.1 deoxycytidine triphosphate deaminase [Caryophanon latum]